MKDEILDTIVALMWGAGCIIAVLTITWIGCGYE